MTYSSLVSDVKSYAERLDDDKLSDQLPRLVMMAENRITADLRILGTQEVAAGAFDIGDPQPVKPAYWRRTVSFNYTDPTAGRVELLPRTYEYCRDYWPVTSQQGSPRFYADYDYDHFLIVATPSSAFPFEIVYIARLPPLSDDVQINWLTSHAPQVLLNATLLEMDIWLKNFRNIPARQANYDASVGAMKSEDGVRAFDRNIILA
jgi:hypothetical protein